MPTREQIMVFVRQMLDQWITASQDIGVGIYRLLLDYIYEFPRITVSNRLKRGVWRDRAKQVERSLAGTLHCQPEEVGHHVDVLMRTLYATDAQRMNPVGIAFACSVVYFVQRFAPGSYQLKMEPRIGVDVFPGLTGFRRRSVDIAAFEHEQPAVAISSKWGMRHDRIRDPQEEADIYKQQVPSLKFVVVTNEFDSARLQKVLTYQSIDGVYHVQRDLVWQVYGGMTQEPAALKDLTELPALFP